MCAQTISVIHSLFLASYLAKFLTGRYSFHVRALGSGELSWHKEQSAVRKSHLESRIWNCIRVWSRAHSWLFPQSAMLESEIPKAWLRISFSARTLSLCSWKTSRNLAMSNYHLKIAKCWKTHSPSRYPKVSYFTCFECVCLPLQSTSVAQSLCYHFLLPNVKLFAFLRPVRWSNLAILIVADSFYFFYFYCFFQILNCFR